jgi:hypothetical protein
MRARSLVPLAFCFASALAAYACGNGTFANKLPLYDPDAGSGPSEDSAAPAEDAAADVTMADVQVGDAGNVRDAGDAETKDAGGAETSDAGDGGAHLDAGDGGG